MQGSLLLRMVTAQKKQKSGTEYSEGDLNQSLHASSTLYYAIWQSFSFQVIHSEALHTTKNKLFSVSNIIYDLLWSLHQFCD